MCGRYSLYAPSDEVARIFAVPLPDAGRVLNAGPRYNIAPTTNVAVVRRPPEYDDREIALLRWGLIPNWAKEFGKGPLLINARGETVAEKPAFRSSFRNRRCLVVADGFFEWQKLPDRKQPHHFQVDGGSLFAFAGIWDMWEKPGGGEVESCAIITTRANELGGLVHDRMPVILPSESWNTWLEPGQNDRTANETLKSLLCPYPADRMNVYPVNAVVSNPRNNVLECVEPVGPSLELGDVPC